MKTKPATAIILSIIVLLLTLSAFACDSSGEEEMWARQFQDIPNPPSIPVDMTMAPAAGISQAEAGEAAVVEMEAAMPAAPAAGIGQAGVGEPVVVEMEAAMPAAPAAEATLAQLASQRRVIIRTVNMSIVVGDIQNAIDEIADLADSLSGWVVSTDRRQEHAGSVSVRVPAEDLDSAIESLRRIAKDVESEISTSQDVTDEYFDLQSRLKNQRATEAALIGLLEIAESVEDALEVQRELSKVQENVERLLGRIKLLEETSAYSLITINLKLAPVDMPVAAGPDQSVAAYAPIRFKATFSPPEGMDEHTITWDFGDGSHPITTDRSAPTADDGERVSATVTHSYNDPRDSPFIVQVTISSYGKSGVAEGEDTLIVTVSETPVIEVFAGEGDYYVLQGETVEFSGSFTRPSGLSDVRYQWDFGDGSSPVEGELRDGITRVDMTHAYADYRSTPYRVRFTIMADSAVGEITSSHEVFVWVEEDPGLIAGNFDLGYTSKDAVRTLSVVVSGLTTTAIWLGIFSVLWVPLAVVATLLIRRRIRFRAEHSPTNPSSPAPQREPGPEIG